MSADLYNNNPTTRRGEATAIARPSAHGGRICEGGVSIDMRGEMRGEGREGGEGTDECEGRGEGRREGRDGKDTPQQAVDEGEGVGMARCAVSGDQARPGAGQVTMQGIRSDVVRLEVETVVAVADEELGACTAASRRRRVTRRRGGRTRPGPSRSGAAVHHSLVSKYEDGSHPTRRDVAVNKVELERVVYSCKDLDSIQSASFTVQYNRGQGRPRCKAFLSLLLNSFVLTSGDEHIALTPTFAHPEPGPIKAGVASLADHTH
ncbi:hypothetical protein K438DRAFT_1772093 [Mycena galopus ATCC 62051]|nr:hypothetical protein K438DRAFT_1772093 [Mycena galopus ATCC 62051]